MARFNSIRRRMRGWYPRAQPGKELSDNQENESNGGGNESVTSRLDTRKPPSPWDLVAWNAEELTAVARGMVNRKEQTMQTMETMQPTPDIAGGVARTQQLTHLEKLPQEIKLHIMSFLDHFSLYRLTQAYEDFNVLAFDNVFEDDPYWRTLRHTVDCLGDGPENRVLPLEIKGEVSGSAECGSSETALPYANFKVEERDRRDTQVG